MRAHGLPVRTAGNDLCNACVFYQSAANNTGRGCSKLTVGIKSRKIKHRTKHFMACGRNYCVLLGVYGNAFSYCSPWGMLLGFAPAFARIAAVRFAACCAVVSCGNYLIVFNYHGSVLTTKTGGSSCNGCRDRKVIFVFAYTLIHYKFSFAAFKPLLKTFRTEIVLKNGSESRF